MFNISKVHNIEYDNAWIVGPSVIEDLIVKSQQSKPLLWKNNIATGNKATILSPFFNKS